MPDDAAQIASELSGLLKAGAADPLSLLAGEWRFHACFLAPFTPGFAESRRQFLVDGGGPLSATVEQLRHQGLSASEATETARRLMESATGLCVAVVAGDHGVASIPQPFFGHLSQEWRQGAAQVLAADYRAPFAAALAGLEAQAEKGWPRIVAGPALKDGDLKGFWLELAHGVAEASELAGLREDARQADLGHWVAEAVAVLAGSADLDAEDHAALCRCRLVAGETLAATTELAACAAAGGESETVELLDILAGTVCRSGGPAEVAAWLAAPPEALHAYGYDVALARVRILAALGGSADDLRPGIAALIAADRKLARQALTREPLWQVTAPDPGELLDTATVAELLGRSPTAIAKRIEARTMPVHAAEGQVRIPRRALEAWRTVLGEHGLLDA
jgi:hypothetical protein